MRDQHMEALLNVAGSREFLDAHEALNPDEHDIELDEAA